MNRPQVFIFTMAACMCLVSLPLHAAPVYVAPCVACHGDDGMGQGNPMIPVIAGMPAEHIEEAIFAYVDGARRCTREPRMCAVVAELSEDAIVELSEYLRYAIESYFSGDRESLLATMANRILLLEPGDLGALVHYYSSYRAAE